ncbi:Protein of unknown function DUF516 [Ignisphaera aggregans DSM 17230]|uniref:D-aminoacyl-tRNA deacylase n=1 Tax=Ignisphaera aggregans (strain DSM 17230 / JCM 13409 / AQ1.S1) TaxID=583356 RepID=E0SR16_IGNAA|nr:Protein of unknown function DUF516 [Ignisphaera aggregans DSM 17230]
MVYSVNDVAGAGMAKRLREYFNCRPLSSSPISFNDIKPIEIFSCSDYDTLLLGFNEDTIYFDFLSSITKSKSIIVLSKHSSQSGLPSLTTHPTGNPWGRNDFGGRPWELSLSNPIFMWLFLKNIKKFSDILPRFEISYEVTHHGPTSIRVPLSFVEIGSTESEWKNEIVQDIMARGIMKTIEDMTNINDKPCIATVGFGGPHYAPIFTKRAFEYSECYGHMIPNYVIRELSDMEIKKVVELALSYTPYVDRIVIEKIRSDAKRIITEVARSRGIEVVKI